MRQSIKSRLSSTILVIVLLTIGIISFLSNILINKQFTNYISKQQELKAQIITSSISQQYSTFTDQWNMDYVHAIGMFSLYEGYIIKVYDKDGMLLWDAQAHDMKLCNQIMDEISERMRIQYPQLNGDFTSVSQPLSQDGNVIGSVSISYFGPFFLNENEFRFIHSLNIILLSVGVLSLVVSLLVGHLLAKRISRPILNTVEVTKQIADGKYEARLEEKSDTDELQLLITSINHLAESLETMEKLRKQLTEDVAHELRTPITILQSYLEAMTEGIWEPSEERLQSCYDEVVRIGTLVKDLESLAKLEKDNLHLNKQEIDLRTIIDQVVSTFEAESMNKKLLITVQGGHTYLMADLSRIKQVVVNLLSNAIKYSEEGCNITVALFENKDNVGFSIQDTGAGIPADELPYIFERFYRADKSRNRMTGGSGIGLTIVKSILHAHGGNITVQSELGQGSTFTVTLPKA
ncbi:MAG: integral rane sensor signal transduction histidine kinase [Firmicutes bacterium]|nr:integral rane sensor signal transduction histidine kinase [Bacillota bacterium]